MAGTFVNIVDTSLTVTDMFVTQYAVRLVDCIKQIVYLTYTVVRRERRREPEQAASADCSGNHSVRHLNWPISVHLLICYHRSLASPDAETANELVIITHNLADDLKRMDELKISQSIVVSPSR